MQILGYFQMENPAIILIAGLLYHNSHKKGRYFPKIIMANLLIVVFKQTTVYFFIFFL